MIEGILSSVYSQLDQLVEEKKEEGIDIEMDETSHLKLTNKQSSVALFQNLPEKIEYQTDMASCKKVFKDSTFKLNF